MFNNSGNVNIKNKKYNQTLTGNKNNSENNTEIFTSSSKRIKKKRRTSTQFFNDQKKYAQKHKINIENIVKVQNAKFNESMKKKPTISEDSRRLADKLKNKKEKYIYVKLYNDYSLREKNKEELRKKSLMDYNIQVGLINDKKLSKRIIKQNSERLYKEYLKKDSFIQESKNKQNKKFKKN